MCRELRPQNIDFICRRKRGNKDLIRFKLLVCQPDVGMYIYSLPLTPPYPSLPLGPMSNINVSTQYGRD